MDFLWDVLCYAAGLTNTPSLTSTPVLPEHCQRDINQYYEIGDVISRGSFGSIRRVRLLCSISNSYSNNNSECEITTSSLAYNDQYYACKTIPKSKLYDRKLLRREVYNLNRCNTNNNNNNYIVRLLDVIEDRGSIHIVTELCEGGELYDFIVEEHKRTGRGLWGTALSSTVVDDNDDDGRDDIDNNDDNDDDNELRCATIIFQILTSFRYLHDDVGICHRDMKASNFVFVQKPSISLVLRVIDFGLSKYVGKQQNDNDKIHNSIDNNVRDKNNDKNRDSDNIENENDVNKNANSATTNFNHSYNYAKNNCSHSHDHDDDINGDIDEKIDEGLLFSNGSRYMTSEVGTPYYVAPEVLTQPNGYTTKCDIWSIGVLAYLTLTGTLPVMGTDERDTVQKLMNPNLTVDFSNKKLWYQDDEDIVVEDNDDDDKKDQEKKSNGDTNNDNNNQTSIYNNKRKISRSARDFCQALLQRCPKKRPTAREALQFDWIVKNGEQLQSQPQPLPLAATGGVHHQRELPSLSIYRERDKVQTSERVNDDK